MNIRIPGLDNGENVPARARYVSRMRRVTRETARERGGRSSGQSVDGDGEVARNSAAK